MQEDRERDDMAAFAGRNAAKLLAVYDRRRAGLPPPLCWPAVLFPQAWFLYRKLYVWAALVTAGPLILAAIPHMAWASWGAVLVGAMGYELYIGHARRTIRRIRADFGEEDEAQDALRRAGGVSFVGFAIGLVFIFAFFILTLKPGLLSPVPP